jgi:hypothetical protein
VKILINGLDVWGNADDGFEINDVLGSHGSIEVPDDADDKAIIQALVDADIIYKSEFYELDDMSGINLFANLCDSRDGRPILQLRGAE